MEYPEYKSIIKYNNGNGAILCNNCARIVFTGGTAWNFPDTPTLCEKCWSEIKKVI